MTCCHVPVSVLILCCSPCSPVCALNEIPTCHRTKRNVREETEAHERQLQRRVQELEQRHTDAIHQMQAALQANRDSNASAAAAAANTDRAQVCFECSCCLTPMHLCVSVCVCVCV